MSTPTFAKTHNLIAYLEKPTKSEGFTQIIDFLNGNSVKYALTASPTIYTSCITHFWTSAKVKTVNDEVRIQALVDGKRVNIKESSIRRILRLDDFEERLKEENRILKEHKSVHSTDNANELVMKKEKSSKQERKIVDIDADVEINLEKAQAEAYNLDLDHLEKVLSMLDVIKEEPGDVEEVLEVVKAAKLITKVVTTAGETKVSVPRKRRGVIIQDPKETTKTATMQPKIKLDEEVARQLEAELNADINWNVMIDQVKRSEKLHDAGMTYDEIRSLFEKHYNFNQDFLDEVNERVKVSETEQETKELKKHLQIVPDNDDDVYTNATPLASKIPIVDYKIHTERNRPYFKIIRANGNHMLFISFSTMMKNFDREDLESLWKIIRERFKKTEPKNYSDDYLLNTLKIMFEKPNVEASMLNDVRLQVEDESEMSLELLRLVKRQLNEGGSVNGSRLKMSREGRTIRPRLEVEEESEMSLSRLVRRHLNEGYVPE
nr:hypothetical protein [Tanacetum cinerariifolium]